MPRITAPAARSRATTKASRGAIEPSSASDPAVVVILSPVSMLSLIRTGMPCSGPRGPERLPLGVERVGDGQRVGVDLDDRADRRPRLIDGRNPLQIALGDRPRRKRPGAIHSCSCAVVASLSSKVSPGAAGWARGPAKARAMRREPTAAERFTASSYHGGRSRDRMGQAFHFRAPVPVTCPVTSLP